jgi:hypothetical protein
VLCLARGKIVSNQCETNFGAKCLEFLKCRKNQAGRRRAIDFLSFVGMAGTSGRAWQTFVFVLMPDSIVSVTCGREIAQCEEFNCLSIPVRRIIGISTGE